MLTKIFISYGREDTKAAKRIYKDLRAYGYDPWLDTESLLAGEKFEHIIRKAIRESRFFLALLSHSSVNRKGFLNKEIAEAIDILKEYPPKKKYLIPVRLDDCKPSHEELSELHRVDMFPSWDSGLEKIRKAVESEVPRINALVGREKPAYSTQQRKEIINREIANYFEVNESTITAQTSFVDLGGDYLDAFEIRGRLKGDFGIEISEEDAEGSQVIGYVLRAKYEGGA